MCLRDNANKMECWWMSCTLTASLLRLSCSIRLRSARLAAARSDDAGKLGVLGEPLPSGDDFSSSITRVICSTGGFLKLSEECITLMGVHLNVGNTLTVHRARVDVYAGII